MVRLSPLDELRVRSIRKDIYARSINTQLLPNLELVRKLGTSNTAFIRKSLSNIARAQSKFEIALSNPFLVDRSAHFSLHLLAYAPALKIFWRAQDMIPYLSDVGTFPWSQDTKIQLKSGIPPEDRDAWLDHAKRQSSQRLNPVTAIGLTMVMYNYSHRVKRHDEKVLS
ncbi:hypothetical protein BGAL_0756g00040 [Botrytis galanthina]|uniref:Uncharacterized protein n=1 Tax=Botrytis galanthina TaxID=278940 RepID=A0A4S8QTM9_9HELO|nr:hypothetical protein BGAL_0756g00040 [Botrytis galanthina]